MKSVSLLFLLVIMNVTANSQDIAHVLYVESFGGENRELPLSITPAYDGGIVLAYSSDSDTGNINTSCHFSNYNRVIFRKYGASGMNLEWEKCIPDYKYKYLFETGSNEYVYIGSSWDGIGPTDRDFVIKKEDKNGVLLWSKNYGGTNTEQLKDVLATKDSGYLLLGETSSNDGDVGPHPSYGMFQTDMWAIKIDSLGTKVWSKVFGGTYDDRAKALAHAPGNGYYLAGTTTSKDYECDCTKNPGMWYDVFLTRLDSAGNIIWKKCMGSEVSGVGCQGMVDDGKGGVYLTAKAGDGSRDIKNFKGGRDIWVIHVDSSGQIVWSNCYGGKDIEDSYSICRSDDDKIWVAGISSKADGQVYTNIGNSDAWILKIAPDGTLESSRILGTPGYDLSGAFSTDENYIAKIHPLSQGSVIVMGTFDSSGVPGDIFPQKYYGGISDVFIARIAPWTISIEKLDKQRKFNVYPNPASSHIYIENNLQKNIDILVTDIAGKKLHANTTQAEKVIIPVENWPRGMYLLTISQSTNAKIFQYKILIQ